MNVLLIRPPNPLQHVKILTHTKPMNLAYLASYLRKHSFKVCIVDYETRQYSDDDLFQILNDKKPSIIGVSCMTPTIRNGAKICYVVKKYSNDIVTVVGGPHANSLPVQVLKEFSAFDYLIYGEGEVTLLELCNYVQNRSALEQIKGLVYRNGNEIMQNPKRELINDLDEIPFPARDLFAYGKQVGHVSRGFSNKLLATTFYTSRGCPYSCGFCAIQNTFGRTVRFRKISKIEEEIRMLVKDYNFNHIVIADDTFCLKKDRTIELCDVLKRNGIKSWSCDTRANTITKEVLVMMKKSGCKKVAFGVESGSKRILGLNNKQVTVEQIKSAVNWANEVGIKHVEGDFIIGSDPSETINDLEMTRKLILSLPWTLISVSVIVPFPGTHVYEIMREKRMIHDDADWEDFVMFGSSPKWHTEHFSSDDLIELQKKITKEFYLRPNYMIQRLMRVGSAAEIGYWLSSAMAFLKWYSRGRLN